MHFCFVWFSRHQWVPPAAAAAAAAAQSFMNKKKLWFCSSSSSSYASSSSLWCELCVFCVSREQKSWKQPDHELLLVGGGHELFTLEAPHCNISHARLAELLDQSVCFHRYVCVCVCVFVCLCVSVFHPDGSLSGGLSSRGSSSLQLLQLATRLFDSTVCASPQFSSSWSRAITLVVVVVVVLLLRQILHLLYITAFRGALTSSWAFSWSRVMCRPLLEAGRK